MRHRFEEQQIAADISRARRVVLDSSSGVPLLSQSDIHLVEFQNYDPRRS